MRLADATADGKPICRQLLVLTEDGELIILEADPATVVRKARWAVGENGPIWAHLAVAGSRLFVKDCHDVYCFDLSPP